MEVKHLMKPNFWITLVAVSSLGLWSCSQDSITNDVPQPGKPDNGSIDATAFMGFKLVENDNSTRDSHREYDDEYERFEWFNKGTINERAIIDNAECNRVLFFNDDYSYFGSGKLGKPDVSTTSSSIFVAPKPENAEGIPAYAIVVMNGDPQRLDQLDTDLFAAGDNAVNLALNYLNQVDTDDPESLAMYDGYFTMSSTVYKDTDYNIIDVLKKLDSDGPVFYDTVEEAIEPEHLTSFNVERLLSKFTLIIKDGNRRFDEKEPIVLDGPNRLKVRVTYAPTDESSKDVMSGWKINLVNWGMNGLEKNTYLVKTLVEDPGTYPWTLSKNFYAGWNDAVLQRSYWAIDENYSSGIYPDQYRQALDVEGVKAATTNNIYSADYKAEDGLTKDKYTLIYKPYNAFTDRTENKYSLENTFDASILNDQNISSQPWLRCGTHIILTAQLIVNEIDKDIDLTKVDETGFISGVADKYFSNGMYWSEQALKEQAIATLMTNLYYNKKGEQIENVLNGGFVEYINSEDHPLDDIAPVADGDGNPLTHEDLSVNADKYFEFAPAFIKGGDGWVSLKKKDNVKLLARYKNQQTGEIILKEISEEQLVSYIYRFTNLAKHYKEGRMYYAIAIRHNLDSSSFEKDPVAKVATADYGVVRNTWYRMTLDTILKPGTPVDDPNQPIIPNPEPDDKSLGVEVEIIPWRMLDINVDQLH